MFRCRVLNSKLYGGHYCSIIASCLDHPVSGDEKVVCVSLHLKHPWILATCPFGCFRGSASGVSHPSRSTPLSIHTDRVPYIQMAPRWWAHNGFWWCGHLSVKLWMPPSKPVVRDMYKKKAEHGADKNILSFVSQTVPLVYLNGRLLQVSIVTSRKSRERNKWRVIENTDFTIKNCIWIFSPLSLAALPSIPTST